MEGACCLSKKKALDFEEYYSRQVVMKEFGRKGQRRLAQSRVAVVGLGGLGTASSLYLALAGVGYLRLIDQDTVELKNLHRQILYSPEDLRYPKVEVAAERLRKANPFVEVEAVPENLNVGNVERLLSGVGCVVDGLDNMGTRYLVNRACAKLGIPYVFGAAIGIEGNLSVFSAPETPCLECVFPGVKDADVMSCDVRGVVGATPGIIGSMQAIETIKVLANVGTPLKGKLLICDFSDMYFTTIDVFKKDNCPVCRGSMVVSEARERLVWLCGQKTANINPEEPWKMGFAEVCNLIKRLFKVKVRSRLAIIFDYKSYEVTLFGGGRMLIKNVDDETHALKAYREISKKLGMD